MAICNDGVAAKAGVNAGIVAEVLRERLDSDRFTTHRYGKKWCRCSFKTITVLCPFLTVGQVEYAINMLRNKGIISSSKMTAKSFDHTNWYAFTEYGNRVMKWGDANAKENS